MTLIRHPAPLSHPAKAAHRCLRALCQLALATLVGVASAGAIAAEISGEQMSAVLPDTASASFASPQAPGVLVTVAESGTATMAGSDLFGYVGLWLGAAGNGGGYSVQFSQPVSRFSLSFVALTALGGGDEEWLQSFNTDGPTTVLLSSPDGSAAWDGSRLRGLDEDSRGVLTFSAALASGFSLISFSHVQTLPLNGFVISQLGFDLMSLVPEPAAWLLWAGGLAGLGWRARRWPARPRNLCANVVGTTAGRGRQACASRSGWPHLAGACTVLGLAAVLVACGGGTSPQAAAPTTPAKADTGADAVEALSAAMAVGGTADAAAGPLLATQRDAVRLADQATFGPTEALVARIRQTGAEAWIASQLLATGARYTSGGNDLIHKPVSDNFCLGRPDTCWRDYFSTEPLLWDFYRNALGQPDQLRQRLAFALGQIAVVSEFEVFGTYGYRRYHNMLLQNAFGNYRELLRRVVLSPMMGEYLDHVNNDRLQPNENFARELLQLFSLGTCLLNPNGSLVGGNCQPTYDNETVRHYAFALTGWTYPPGGSATWGCWPENANCAYLDGEMVGRAALQDDQPRNLLSGISVPAARTPAQALDKVLDSLMAHPNMAPFIGRQLIQHLVKSNPSPAYIKRVADVFVAGRFARGSRSFGNGVRGDLAATVAAILLDAEARNSAPPLVAEKLREPVLMMTGVLRALNGRSDGQALGGWWGQELRQQVFRAPSVFNFYPPNFPVAGTRLVGPAFGIYNANTAFARLNFINQLLNWGGMEPDASVPGATGSSVNLAAFMADAGDAAKLVDRLQALATGGRASAATRAQILAAVNAWPTDDPGLDWRTERVRTAAYLVFAAPAYQVLN